MAQTPLRVLMVASEAQPFSKTGGLADVTTALAQALGRLGHEVTLVTPRYRDVPAGVPRATVEAELAGRTLLGAISEVLLGDNVRALLIDCRVLYDRPGIYAHDNTDYGDNALRFAFLSRAAVHWASATSPGFSILHGHDWQAGLTPVYAAGRWPTVFTVHNLAFQGVFDKAWVPALGLAWRDFTVDGFEFWDRISLLKAGVMFSDALTTVSPTYADEMQRAEYGYGFDGIMRRRAAALVGIRNGIDDRTWDPRQDAHLPAPYSVDDLAGKHAAKRALLARFRLPVTAETLARPIIAMVSRMAHQKGLDLIAALSPRLPTLGATFIVMGTGEPQYEAMWQSLASRHPEQFGVRVGYDEPHAHLIEAGADLFMMPSRYEPCGLNQMYSMRYGTVPVVRAVGGLVDTVRPYDALDGQGTGFLFEAYRPEALWNALQQALAVFHRQPALWQRLQVNGMTRDFSWERSAAEYVALYQQVIARAAAR